MKLRKICEILHAEVICTVEGYESFDIRFGFCSDLMSDVLTFVESGSLLITGLTNAQVIRTAEIVEVSTICFVRDKRPTEGTIALARETGVVLLATGLHTFEACGHLSNAGLPGCVVPQ